MGDTHFSGNLIVQESIVGNSIVFSAYFGNVTTTKTGELLCTVANFGRKVNLKLIGIALTHTDPANVAGMAGTATVYVNSKGTGSSTTINFVPTDGTATKVKVDTPAYGEVSDTTSSITVIVSTSGTTLANVRAYVTCRLIPIE